MSKHNRHWFVYIIGLTDVITGTSICLFTRWWSPKHLLCLHVQEADGFRCASKDEAASWLAFIAEVGVA